MEATMPLERRTVEEDNARRDAAGGDDIEEGGGRPTGPRWAEVRVETLRSHRADALAIWCRRLGGLVVWGFIGVIFFQLWQVAWQVMDIKLLTLCILITLSILYILLKRYRHIREIGLTGVDLVRAMTVDEGEELGLRGVTRKARAVCVDFKFDPQAAFQERALGCGFEPYPPRPSSGSFVTVTGTEDDKSSRKVARRRLPWLWDWRRIIRQNQSVPVSTRSNADETEDDLHRVNAENEKQEDEDERDNASTAGLTQHHNRRSSRGADEEEDEFVGLPAVGQAAAAAGEMVPAGGAIGGGGIDEEAVAGGEIVGVRGPLRPQPGQVVRACELNPSCSICLFEYFLEEEVTLLPCGHLYHTECIDIWMTDHVDCPYCRADLNAWGTAGANGSAAGGRYCPPRESAAASATAAAAAAAAAASAAAGGSSPFVATNDGSLPPPAPPSDGLSSGPNAGAAGGDIEAGASGTIGGDGARRSSGHPPWAAGIL